MSLAGLLTVMVLLLASAPASGFVGFPAPGDEVIGAGSRRKVARGESIIELARHYDLGYNELADANPALDSFAPRPGNSAVIPTVWVLPDAPRAKGIVINLSEMRLYYYPSGSRPFVLTYPIGIGAEGSETPIGVFRIIGRKADPTWTVPESILKEKPQLPKQIPPGPDNPLGSHALRLSYGSVMIHGTNRPWGVGRRASHGCIRLYPEDIPKLFQVVEMGDPVTIVRQPVKLGVRGNRVFLEVHGGEEIDYLEAAVRLIQVRKMLGRIDLVKFFMTIRAKSGVPVDIAR